jgi:hypothetical protein
MQIHIVHFDSEQQIKQIRIHWDQASLLRQVEVIGARGRSWPIRDGKDQIRLLKTALAERETAAVLPTATTLPVRSSSPSKRRIKDPYAAESLDELLSPNKEAAEREARIEASKSSSGGKRYTKDPYGAGSLNEILSPTKPAPKPVVPFAPSSSRPATRNFSDIFVQDDNIPESPSRAQRRAPAVPEEDESGRYEKPVDEDRTFYKTIPGKFSHFDIGGDNSDREVKEETRAQHSNIYQSRKWEFADDYETPVKPKRAPRGEQVRHFDLSEDESPEKLNVIKPRRDADRHFDLQDDENEDGRIISSFGGRGKGLYENRLFDDQGGRELSDREKKNEPLAITGNAANRKKNFDSHFAIGDESPAGSKNNTPAANHDKAVKQMESHWHDYDESPEGKRHAPATAMRNPLTHNQPTWHHGDQ